MHSYVLRQPLQNCLICKEKFPSEKSTLIETIFKNFGFCPKFQKNVCMYYLAYLCAYGDSLEQHSSTKIICLGLPKLIMYKYVYSVTSQSDENM